MSKTFTLWDISTYDISYKCGELVIRVTVEEDDVSQYVVSIWKVGRCGPSWWKSHPTQEYNNAPAEKWFYQSDYNGRDPKFKVMDTPPENWKEEYWPVVHQALRLLALVKADQIVLEGVNDVAS